MIQFDEHFFEMGWFNHQLGVIYGRVMFNEEKKRKKKQGGFLIRASDQPKHEGVVESPSFFALTAEC